MVQKFFAKEHDSSLRYAGGSRRKASRPPDRNVGVGRDRGARIATLLLTCALTIGASPPDEWPLFGANPERSGVGRVTSIGPSNVRTMHVRWQSKLEDIADGAPIVVNGTLYLTTRDGTTYAVDAANGRTMWTFRTTGPKITTSVPAFDASRNVLYVPGLDGRLHALDPGTGHERHDPGFPVRITTAPQTEKDASSLNVANGYLYAQTSGYLGDAPPYVGHVVAVHLADGATHVFNTLCAEQHSLIDPQTCPAQRNGMWSRAGVVVDPDPSMEGRIYVATGNGPYDPAHGNYGDSIISLNADATKLLGSLTPGDPAQLEAADADVGSSSPALLPKQNDSDTPLMGVQGGKNAEFILFDRTHLAGLNKELMRVHLSDELFSAPAVWQDGSHATWIFLGLPGGVEAFRLVTEAHKSRLVAGWHASVATNNQGTSPIVDNGVIFIATNGALVALDASNGRQLWKSTRLGPVHWQSPVAAEGAVFCADSDGNLTAFGL